MVQRRTAGVRDTYVMEAWSYAGTRCPEEQSETQRSSLVLDTTGTYDHKDLCTARAANVARPMYIRLKRAIDGERYSLVWCLLVNGTRFRTGGCRVSRLVRPRERCLLLACLLACLLARLLASEWAGIGSKRGSNGEESERRRWFVRRSLQVRMDCSTREQLCATARRS